jgi:hypothetical protein
MCCRASFLMPEGGLSGSRLLQTLDARRTTIREETAAHRANTVFYSVDGDRVPVEQHN